MPIKPLVEEKETSTPATNTKVVRFAVVSSVPETRDDSPCLPILDICSALCAVEIENQRQREFIGFITDEIESSDQQNLYLVRNLPKTPETQSLEKLLASSHPFRLNPSRDFTLSRRDRLYLAAILACSVLQFHGTWLKGKWGTRDILFLKDDVETRALLDHPYLTSQVSSSSSDWVINSESTGRTTPQLYRTNNSALIRNEILSPLGVALVNSHCARPSWRSEVPNTTT